MLHGSTACIGPRGVNEVFTVSKGSAVWWWKGGGGSERGLRWWMSRNSSNLLWVMGEVTTGHGADSCFWHPGPHVQSQSWNLIYWGTGREDLLSTALLHSDVKIYSDFVPVCSSFCAEMPPVTHKYLKHVQNISLSLSPQTTCRKWPVIYPSWSPVWTASAQSLVSLCPQCYHHL